MASTAIKFGTVVSLFTLFAAYYYRSQPNDVLNDKLENVLNGLIRAENKVQLSEGPKVAIGFGACTDYFAKAVKVLKKSGARPPKKPKHYNDIGTIDELSQVFAYFFEHGAAAERFVSNKTLFHKLVNNSRSFTDTYEALGGNAPAMARRFDIEGCQVLLGGKMSNSLQQVLSPTVKVVGGEIEEDDIHLLLEYARDEKWAQYTSPRANRFIVHSDENNPWLSSLEAFSAELRHFSPTLLVIGGLQMLDNFPFTAGARRERLDKLQALLVNTPRSTRVHFEMASFAEEDCLRDVIQTVVYQSDSLGMNEQELPNLHSMLTNDSITLISEAYPRIATTLDHMRAVWGSLRAHVHGRAHARPLTRLHVHTLAYQAIMTDTQSDWKHSMSAAAKASLVANRHTCGSHDIHLHKAKMLMDDSFRTSRDEGSQRVPLEPTRPVSCWSEHVAAGEAHVSHVEICIAPVLVCTEVKQTGGGGDNVSSAGLVLQI